MTQPVANSTATLRHLNWTYVLVGVADATLLPFIPLLLVERGLSASVVTEPFHDPAGELLRS